jgi:hypothetical protein
LLDMLATMIRATGRCWRVAFAAGAPACLQSWLGGAVGRESASEQAEHEQAPAPAAGSGARLRALAHRGGGNRALSVAIRAARLQRDPEGAPMSGAQGTSVAAPPAGPTASEPTQAQIDNRKQIDDLLADFSQRQFRWVRDWSIAREDEKLKLLERATARDLLWVGPDDESAIERCWSSMGDRLVPIVKSAPYLWNRSIERGADPERIEQTRGQSAAFKKDVLDVTHTNLEANEDRVVAEFQDFGLMPPWDLVRPDHPGKKSRQDPADKPMSSAAPEVGERLREQSRLAKLVIGHKGKLDWLRGLKVGIDLRPFSPGNPTQPDQDIVLFDGLTTWQFANRQWTAVSTELALILNAWPALYAADLHGGLEVLANQPADAGKPGDPLDPAAGEARSGPLAQMTISLTATMRDIAQTRDKLIVGDLDPLDLTPVHDAILHGRAAGASGRTYVAEVLYGIVSDEKETRDFTIAAAKAGVDAVIMLAMIAGIVGTMGGAGLAIGVAGAKVMAADTRADDLKQLYGATVSDAGALVTRSAVTAAAAEAQNARIDLVQQVLMSAVDGVGQIIGEHFDAKALRESGGARGGAGAPRSKADELRESLGNAAEARMAGAATPAAKSPMKPWGMAEEFRAESLCDPVNAGRLTREGVPRVKGDVMPEGQVGAQFDHTTWRIQYDRKLISADEISKADFDFLLENAYHEGDHAQQWFEMIRLKASEGWTFPQLKQRFGVPDEVIRRARQPDMLLDASHPRFAKATEFYESMLGGGARERARILTELPGVTKALEDKTFALESLIRKPGVTQLERTSAEAELQTAWDKYTKVYGEYRSLPEEVEAWRLGRERADWAAAGLQRRADVRAAETMVESARVRKVDADGQLAKFRVMSGASPELVHEAEVAVALAGDDVLRAQSELQAVRSR